MKTNNKFLIRKYSVGVVSVIIGLFILAGANSDDRVYANNESVPPIVSGVPVDYSQVNRHENTKIS